MNKLVSLLNKFLAEFTPFPLTLIKFYKVHLQTKFYYSKHPVDEMFDYGPDDYTPSCRPNLDLSIGANISP